MKTISYLPSKDELLLKLRSTKGKTARKYGRFKLWWDEDGNICALDIIQFMDELEEFNTIQLGGIWKGIRISSEDIKEARQELLKKLEEK
ncbi:MAG: hypothetical protein NUV74_15665 [Candidatus Brocadiaceae bacterium]|nr:hypothetical protein [Candidatus Brocadiaceae bacterium]